MNFLAHYASVVIVNLGDMIFQAADYISNTLPWYWM